jgi:hypothetical protein
MGIESKIETTTDEVNRCAQQPADIHAIEESSSSSPVLIPLRPEGRAVPTPEAPDVARPIVEAVDPAGIAAMEARARALFGLDERQARGKVATAIVQGRRIAMAAGFCFEPGWLGVAMDEAERLRAAGKLKGWHWGIVLGIAGNYAREGGPDAREGPRRPGAPRPFDPAVCLARLRSLGWDIVPDGPDRVRSVQIPGRGETEWRKLPSDLRGEIKAHADELAAHILRRPSP